MFLHIFRKHFNTLDGEVPRAISKKLLTFENRGFLYILQGRKVSPVAKTFHKFGVVVPYDSKTDVGYRPLSESESMLH